MGHHDSSVAQKMLQLGTLMIKIASDRWTGVPETVGKYNRVLSEDTAHLPELFRHCTLDLRLARRPAAVLSEDNCRLCSACVRARGSRKRIPSR